MPFTKEQLEYAEKTQRAYWDRVTKDQLGNLSSFNKRIGEVYMSNKYGYSPISIEDFDSVKPVKKDYNTVGVRFLQGPNLEKVYTYKVKKGAKLRLGQEIVVPTQRDVLANTIAVVVELHKSPQDTGGYSYKFVAGTVSFL